MIDENYATENATIIDARTVVALRKERLEPRHLRLRQPVKIAHRSGLLAESEPRQNPEINGSGAYIRFIRRARGQSVMMKEEPGTPEFWDHYNQLLKGRYPIPAKRNFETLALSYFESDAFKKLKPRTKADYLKYIGHIRTIWGTKDPQKIETQHIYELHRANAHHWRQANYLVQVMVVLMNHARLIGFLKKEHGNPAKGIPLFKQESDGWAPWPDDVRAEFEELATPAPGWSMSFPSVLVSGSAIR